MAVLVKKPRAVGESYRRPQPSAASDSAVLSKRAARTAPSALFLTRTAWSSRPVGGALPTHPCMRGAAGLEAVSFPPRRQGARGVAEQPGGPSGGSGSARRGGWAASQPRSAVSSGVGRQPAFSGTPCGEPPVALEGHRAWRRWGFCPRAARLAALGRACPPHRGWRFLPGSARFLRPLGRPGGCSPRSGPVCPSGTALRCGSAGARP